jgi:hypothetical protein
MFVQSLGELRAICLHRRQTSVRTAGIDCSVSSRGGDIWFCERVQNSKISPMISGDKRRMGVKRHRSIAKFFAAPELWAHISSCFACKWINLARVVATADSSPSVPPALIQEYTFAFRGALVSFVRPPWTPGMCLPRPRMVYNPLPGVAAPSVQ